MFKNNFYKCKRQSNLVGYMLDKVINTPEDKWKNVLEMSLLLLSIDDFSYDNDLMKLIDHFGCHKKLAIYRYKANFCYAWHMDLIRNAALNLQLTGVDSFCIFGEMYEQRKYQNIEKLVYQENSYYLLNVAKNHTVFNFDNDRYLLSIGFPIPNTFEEVKDYLVLNNI